MSKTIKILHICDHVVEEKVVSNDLKTLTRSSDKDYDVIDNCIIKRITKVNQGDDLYIGGIDYELYTHNKIRWIGSVYPDSGTNYAVEYETIKKTITQYDLENCPRCHGNGWYVSLLDSNTNKLSANTGIEKMTQDFVKILLTTKSGNLGTDLTKISGREMTSPDSTKNEIISAVREAETQYKTLQMELASSGAPLPNDEKLYRIEIRDISFDQESLAFFIELVAYNYNGDSVNLNLKA